MCNTEYGRMLASDNKPNTIDEDSHPDTHLKC
jgi:hypothetical protein